tara:strand:- start:563 stop:1531 length:969 start_codon:yes stop_codon:yes gene_type:complete
MRKPEDTHFADGEIAHFLRGIFMGLADAVPGVSGGTIALLLGVYDRLIENIGSLTTCLNDVLKREFRQSWVKLRTVEWRFLFPLLLGVFIAFGVLAHFIEKLLDNYPKPMAGLFFGLVVVSILIGLRMVTEWNYRRLSYMIAVGTATFLLLALSSGQTQNPSLINFFIGGLVAISAMVLPGISGSFLLLTIGMYAPVIEAINDREMSELMVFGLGAVISLGVSVRALGWVLNRYRDSLLACLIGLMIGSLRVLWPWPNGVGVVSEKEDEIVKGTALAWPEHFNDFLWPMLLAFLGFALVSGILRYEQKSRERASTRSEESSI